MQRKLFSKTNSLTQSQMFAISKRCYSKHELIGQQMCNLAKYLNSIRKEAKGPQVCERGRDIWEGGEEWEAELIEEFMTNEDNNFQMKSEQPWSPTMGWQERLRATGVQPNEPFYCPLSQTFGLEERDVTKIYFTLCCIRHVIVYQLGDFRNGWRQTLSRYFWTVSQTF